MPQEITQTAIEAEKTEIMAAKKADNPLDTVKSV